MKNTDIYKFYLFTLSLVIGTLVGHAQSEGLNWTGECYVVTVNDVEVEITSSLTKQGSTFTWEQQGYNTSDTDTFTIVSTSGNWNTQDNLGELSYNLTSGDTTAILSVIGSSEGIIVSLIINGQNADDNDNYSFTIETLNIL